ncbi:MAG: VOC family protein [Bacteroidota bacterium]
MVGWFEIPVTDMERAKTFYEVVFDISISLHELDGFVMGWFPMNNGANMATGSLVQHEMHRPSATHGTLIYFSCKDLSQELNRVVAAGGTIVKEKSEIGDGHGFMALFQDSEGNRIALHSRQ